jgi:F0F1-type ATP synthase assembly protein I
MEDEKLTEEEKADREFEREKKEGFYQPDENPESQVESTRKSGLAYGAVITLVGSILVFLGIGWALDKYFLTSPILLVIGIIFGTIIGFYQFYRLSSQFD